MVGSSDSRSHKLRNVYLQAPLIVDNEYIRHYTVAHKMALKNDNVMPAIELRAHCHAYAMEHLTPVIRDGELLMGSKTRFVRGAVPYCNYASNYIIRELNSIQQEAQDSVTDVGTGGGISLSKTLAQGGEFVTFGKKFLLPKDDVGELRECAEYWTTRCMQAAGDRFWKRDFSDAEYIEKGWNSILYTAAHDPAPEGRIILDYESVLDKGFANLINEMKQNIADADVTDLESARKVWFWNSGVRVLNGVLSWAQHYADAARAQAATETDLKRKQELLDIAERCEWCPKNSPRNFAEAVQGWWLAYLAGHLEGAHLGYSPGKFDRYMYKYYKRDVDAGTLTRGQALELLECVRVKMSEIEYGLGSGNLYQNMILAGTDEFGKVCDNELSVLVVQSAINCQTTQPTLSVWYEDGLSDKFLMKCMECIKTGCGFPAFFNLKIYIEHEKMTSGLDEATIRKYSAMGGCTEPTLEGHAYGIVQAGFINHAKILELAMYGGVDPRTGIPFTPTPVPHTYDELVMAYKAQMGLAIRRWQRYWNYVMAGHSETCNLVYASVLVRDCISRGKSLDEGGARLNHCITTLSTGMVNIANSLSAVKTLIHDNSVCSMDELREAMSSNWGEKSSSPEIKQRHQALHQHCLSAPKYGNDDDYVDSMYLDIYDAYCKIVSSQDNFLGVPYDPSMLAISSHAPFGKACLATPDGRVCGEVLCDGVTSPARGTDVNGPFSVLHSAGKIDHRRIRGGLHNMKFHPTSLAGEDGSRKLLSLIQGYFRNTTGFQIQFNVVDSAKLRDAQLHPENYRDLIVRVAGFSAFFCELSRTYVMACSYLLCHARIQDEVIARTEHTLKYSMPDEPRHAIVGLKTPHPTRTVIPHDIEDTVGTVFDIQDMSLQDGAGLRSTIFLKGCPLRCKWCCNPESQSSSPDLLYIADQCTGCNACVSACRSHAIKIDDNNKVTIDRSACLSCSTHECLPSAGSTCKALRLAGYRVSVKNVMKRILRNVGFFQASGGGVTLSGGEPLIQPEFVHAVALACHANDITVGVETCGMFEMTENVLECLKCLDFAYFDIKAISPSLHLENTGAENNVILSNFKQAVAAIGADRVIVSVPAIHNVNDSIDEISKIAKFVAGNGVKKMRVLTYHAMGVHKYAQLGRQYKVTDGAVSSEIVKSLVAAAASQGVLCTVE